MALDMTLPVLQVVGYQNSGKTTVVCNLLEEGKRLGLRIASLKHHGHGGTPVLGDDQKDSGLHRLSGAVMAGVEGGGVLQIVAQKPNAGLRELLAFYHGHDLDVVVVEGYKRADYPKIVVIRQGQDLKLLKELKGIVAVVSDFPLAAASESYPTFSFHDKRGYVDWFIHYIERNRETMQMFSITDKPISIEAVTQKVVRPEAGAVVNFIGTVREFTGDKHTLSLEYEAYVSMAEKQLAKIGAEIEEKWPEAKVAITHRIGHLKISDIAVVIAISTPHRVDAYEANRYAIERIKQIVPIWKKEHWEDGTEWVGDQLETKSYPNGRPEDVKAND